MGTIAGAGLLSGEVSRQQNIAVDHSYLVDRFSISMIPSATVLTSLNSRQLTPSIVEALVLAHPNSPDVFALGAAQDEAEAVASILGVEAILDATEADLHN